MGKVALRISLGLLLVVLACARIPRNEVERQKDDERLRRQQDSGISTYYLLVKPETDGKNDRTRSEALAADFLTRLGNDKHVTIAAASKVGQPYCVWIWAIFLSHHLQDEASRAHRAACGLPKHSALFGGVCLCPLAVVVELHQFRKMLPLTCIGGANTNNM